MEFTDFVVPLLIVGFVLVVASIHFVIVIYQAAWEVRAFYRRRNTEEWEDAAAFDEEAVAR